MIIKECMLISRTRGWTRKTADELKSEMSERGFTIKPAEIKSYGNATCIARLEDGSEIVVFYYYNDELYFNENQFIGKTVEEANEIRRRADIAYLRS